MVIVTLLVHGERVLEAGTSASLDANPQADDFALGPLAGHELRDLLRSDVCEVDHLPRLYRRWRRYSGYPCQAKKNFESA